MLICTDIRDYTLRIIKYKGNNMAEGRGSMAQRTEHLNDGNLSPASLLSHSVSWGGHSAICGRLSIPGVKVCETERGVLVNHRDFSYGLSNECD